MQSLIPPCMLDHDGAPDGTNQLIKTAAIMTACGYELSCAYGLSHCILFLLHKNKILSIFLASLKASIGYKTLRIGMACINWNAFILKPFSS